MSSQNQGGPETSVEMLEPFPYWQSLLQSHFTATTFWGATTLVLPQNVLQSEGTGDSAATPPFLPRPASGAVFCSVFPDQQDGEDRGWLVALGAP